jgi:Peroxidase
MAGFWTTKLLFLLLGVSEYGWPSVAANDIPCPRLSLQSTTNLLRDSAKLHHKRGQPLEDSSTSNTYNSLPALQKQQTDTLPIWPNPATDELEDIMFLQSGYRSRGFSVGMTPCGYSPFGPTRHGAGEYLRTAFHDMAPASAVGVRAGIGGLDASLQYELNTPGGGENVGAGFSTALSTMGKFFGSRASAADLIALGVYASVRVCNGPVVPIKTGRIDAKWSGPLGVPQPQNDVGTFTNQFARMGFDVSEMIQLVACGHAIGGVGSSDFPTIVNPRSSAAGVDEFVAFSSGAKNHFSEKVASEYLSGNSTNPLLGGPCLQSKRCSDTTIFGADGNATMRKMTNPKLFRDSCKALFQRMIEVVPKGVTLSKDHLRAYEVKPVALDLSLMEGGEVLMFSGEIRVKTTTRLASSIQNVQLEYSNRNGEKCTTCYMGTKPVGTSKGFDDEFTFYGFSTLILAQPSISSFIVKITRADGSTEVYNNGGSGYPVGDMIMLQSPQSCVSDTDSKELVNVMVQAAVRKSIPSPNVNLAFTLPNARPKIPIPALEKTSMLMKPMASVGQYVMYSASYTMNTSQVDMGKLDLTVNGNWADSFRSVASLGKRCAQNLKPSG